MSFSLSLSPSSLFFYPSLFFCCCSSFFFFSCPFSHIYTVYTTIYDSLFSFPRRLSFSFCCFSFKHRTAKTSLQLYKTCPRFRVPLFLPTPPTPASSPPSLSILLLPSFYTLPLDHVFPLFVDSPRRDYSTTIANNISLVHANLSYTPDNTHTQSLTETPWR